jgi:hypothetical protein
LRNSWDLEGKYNIETINISKSCTCDRNDDTYAPSISISISICICPSPSA